MTEWIKKYSLIFFMLGLASCAQREDLAPVVEVKWRDLNTHAKQHRVERGETLYAIAFRYDQDFRQLALINHLPAPYTLRVGQVLQLKSNQSWSPSQVQPSRKMGYTHSVPHYPRAPVPLERNAQAWMWPIKGRVMTGYFPALGKKGLDIAGKKGEKIHAARAGVVAYAGNGLAGYGNLIIIKHDNQFLTAYGDNFRNLVKEGQTVKMGQDIAEIGIVNRRFWGVHFEIRKAGQPINPLIYLR
jgi:lipoprotein NlpD